MKRAVKTFNQFIFESEDKEKQDISYDFGIDYIAKKLLGEDEYNKIVLYYDNSSDNFVYAICIGEDDEQKCKFVIKNVDGDIEEEEEFDNFEDALDKFKEITNIENPLIYSEDSLELNLDDKDMKDEELEQEDEEIEDEEIEDEELEQEDEELEETED